MTSIIHQEVDWDAKWAPHEGGADSGHRKEPQRNCTQAFHLSGNFGQLDATGRPTAGQRTHYMGPGLRVVGGQLRYVYADQPRTRMQSQKIMDQAELVKLYRTGVLRPEHTRSATDLAPVQFAQLGHTAAGSANSPSSSQTAKALGAYTATARRLGIGLSATGASTDPLVYWDGTLRHEVDPPSKRKDVLIQQPTTATFSAETSSSLHEQPVDRQDRLTGSLASTARTRTIRDNTQRITAADLAQYSYADSIRTYGMVFKPVGHREYENITKRLEGLSCWENTQSHITSSTATGRPSRQMGTWEHTTKLSLRR